MKTVFYILTLNLIFSFISCNYDNETEKEDKDIMVKYFFYGKNEEKKQRGVGNLYIKEEASNNTYLYEENKDTIYTLQFFYKDLPRLIRWEREMIYIKTFDLEVLGRVKKVHKFDMSEIEVQDGKANLYINQDYGLILVHDVSWNLYETVERDNVGYSSALISSLIKYIEANK